MVIKGIHYRNRFFYELQNRIKLGPDTDLRFRLAAEFIRQNQSILDLCAGTGRLRNFLPAGCHYSCIEASPEFAAHMRHNGVSVREYDLHRGLPDQTPKVDVAVMLVSLCQFRHSSADNLLESLKTVADKVVIVEDVLPAPCHKFSLKFFLMNYLCQRDYYRPIGLLTRSEFEALMLKHGFVFRRHDDRYCLGLFGF